MAQTKAKSKTTKSAVASTMSSGSNLSQTAEVLTLAETAAYLRLPEQEVLRLVHDHGLPGRSVGTQWRFLRTAIQDWLRTPPSPSKDAVLSRIGAWKDDPYLDGELKDIYENRGRPMTEEAS